MYEPPGAGAGAGVGASRLRPASAVAKSTTNAMAIDESIWPLLEVIVPAADELSANLASMAWSLKCRKSLSPSCQLVELKSIFLHDQEPKEKVEYGVLSALVVSPLNEHSPV